MKKTFLIIIIIVVLAIGVLIFVPPLLDAPVLRRTPSPVATSSSTVPNSDSASSTLTTPVASTPVSLFYYNPEKDKDASGNINCSRAGLTAVKREIVSANLISDTLNLLLAGQLTAEEEKQGISTEYPLAGLELIKTDLENGHLTLTFNDPLYKTGGGSCRVGILWFQIEATAKQFPEVKEVRFLPEELFQP
jgi:spore germination protein GerM